MNTLLISSLLASTHVAANQDFFVPDLSPVEDKTNKPHPLRQELIDEIKSKTNKWVPNEIADNKFNGASIDEIYNSMGSKDIPSSFRRIIR